MTYEEIERWLEEQKRKKAQQDAILGPVSAPKVLPPTYGSAFPDAKPMNTSAGTAQLYGGGYLPSNDSFGIVPNYASGEPVKYSPQATGGGGMDYGSMASGAMGVLGAAENSKSVEWGPYMPPPSSRGSPVILEGTGMAPPRRKRRRYVSGLLD